jgi:hypothetical protein
MRMRSVMAWLAACSLIASVLPKTAWAGEHESNPEAEALAMKSRQLAASGASEEAITIAERVIKAGDDVPAWIRQIALDSALKASVATHDLEGQARYALLLNWMANHSLPEDQRRYARQPWVDTICERYDRKNGAGSCALLALKVTGEVSLHDRSLGRKVRTLQDNDVERAHQDFLPLVRDCLATATHADPERFEGEAGVDVSWGIDRNGRAVEVEVSPRRMREALGGCISERLSWFRYPKSDSQEMKFVSLSFELTTVVHTELVSTP